MIVRDQSPPGDPYFLLLGLLLVAAPGPGWWSAWSRWPAPTPTSTGAPSWPTSSPRVLVVPVGAALALVERNRWGTGVLLVALLTVAAMQLRLDSLWSGAGA